MEILNWPFIYNLRFLVAGNQQKTKNYIESKYKKYNCKSVLDLGCGTGDFCTIFRKSEYLGVDINPKYIEFCKKKFPGYKFKCYDLTKFPVDKQRVDCVIFISTLHHLSDAQVKNIFKKAIKITKKIIIIVDLNPETDLIRLTLIKMDRGDFVRTTKEKLKILKPFGNILEVKHFVTRLASQSGLVLKPKK